MVSTARLPLQQSGANMRYYDFNYTMLSDGSVLVQYRDHTDDDNSIRPTYQALKREIASAIEWADSLNAKANGF